MVREFHTDVADDVSETRLGLPRGTVADAAFRGAELVEAVTGKITLEQWVESFVERLALLCPVVSLAPGREEGGSGGHDP